MRKREEYKQKRKKELLKLSKRHQQSLHKDLNESSERIVVFSKNVLAVGGLLYIGYTVLERFLDAKLGAIEKKKDPNRYETLNKVILPIVIFGLQQGSMTLLKKARLMLMDYIEKERDVLQE